MIGMVIATDQEAAPFLTRSTWQRIANSPFQIYSGYWGTENFPVALIVSGIGKVAAAVATHILICKYGVTQIFNLGVCGALKDSKDFEVGAIFRINTAIEGDRKEGARAVDFEKCASGPFNHLPCARLVTCDRPVFNTRKKMTLSDLGDLVDMEGAAIVRVANMYSLPCSLVKGITDGAKEGDRQVLIQNIAMVSRKLLMLFKSLQKDS
ncbi:MAG: hypothetical protein PVI90_03455 [Desulfobacteraceae bacterium]|jgi:adenosylhomocysteine nucleosidase